MNAKQLLPALIITFGEAASKAFDCLETASPFFCQNKPIMAAAIAHKLKLPAPNMRSFVNSIFYIFVSILLFAACTSPKKADTLFEKIDSGASGINFANNVENTEDFNIFIYRNFYNGGGVAIGDINNDGLADVYFTSNMGKNKLYLNKGDFHFEDITKTAGVAGAKFWSTGVVMVDINADGLLDIYVCNAGYSQEKPPSNELFINLGPDSAGIPVFEEQAEAYGLNEKGYTTHAAFFDYDLDGDLDCYILNNSFMPVNTLNYSNNRELYAADWPVKDFLKGGGDKLLRNDNGHFNDVSKQAGIFGSLIGFGLGITVGDVNGDYLPDLYVSNDFYERDYLYINQGDGTFKEEAELWMSHLSLASMGADMADINNDGYPEIFTTEMLPDDETRLKSNTMFENFNIYQLKQERGFYHQYMQNCLQLNNKDKTFSEIAYYSGVAASDWSWGALLFDMDNDGYRDIYVCNGIYKDLTNQDFMDFFADEVVQKMALTGQKKDISDIIKEMPSIPILNKVFHNNKNLKFNETGNTWGFTTPSFSNGAAYGDLDNDGDLDLIINNVNQEAFVYRNHADKIAGNHHLRLQLKGKGQNTFAIGATSTIYQNGQQLNSLLNPTRGFQSSVDYTLVFGLGTNPSVDSIVIVWPDKSKTLMLHPPIDTLLTFFCDKASSDKAINPFDLPLQGKPVAQEVACNFESHQEDDFVDFYQEGLSFKMISREGPKAAVADVNGDGLDDVYIGGASKQAGQLYTQTSSGKFIRSSRASFDQDSLYEDTDVTFFDADGDGDADLFVGSGGNALPMNARFMQNRLYMNDGKGRFTSNERALPLSGLNTAVAKAFDYDGDGDLDLFVGSRSVPAQYGLPPRHFLYQNDGKGSFKDVTRNVAPQFSGLGMVTDAILANVVGDATPELIIVGEWNSPKIFEIKSGQLNLVPSNLNQYTGWYSAIQSDDVDGDGDQDLILGNRGENFYLKGDYMHPSKLWVGDFDGNGRIQKIVTRQINGKDMPIPMKKELTDQIPSLKKKNLKYVDYSTKSIQDLFPEEVLKSTIVLESAYFSSAVAINEGNGKFTLQALPAEVQFSSVCAIEWYDLNGDGKNDLIMAGNQNCFIPQYSKLDASFGHVLLNIGGGQYQRLDNRTSGYLVRGDIKTLAIINIKGKKHLLSTANGRTPTLHLLKSNDSAQ